MNSEQHTPLEEVLDEIVLTEAKPSHEALTRWSKRYPEHREALASFFATWALQESTPANNTGAADEERAGRRMVSDGLNLLYQQQTARAAAAEAPRLSEAIKTSGLSQEEAAARCGIDESMLVKLDRRRIRYETIPRLCFERIAAALGRGIEFVQRTCNAEPLPIGANKAHGKPTIKTEDFLDAVRASDLPDEAKAEWVKAATAERTTGGTS